jgi:hypothetical protein
MMENLQTQYSVKKPISCDARDQFWRSHLESWATSGLSQAEYCRQNDLNIARFGYWKRRFSKENLPVEFVQVPTEPIKSTRLIQNTGAPSLRITMGSEFAIEILDEFSPATLEKVLLTLKKI